VYPSSNQQQIRKTVAQAAKLRKSFLSATVLLSLILSIPVYAYIPPSEFILKSWVGKHAGIKDIKIRSHLTVYDNSVPMEPGLQVVTIFQSRTGDMDVTVLGPSNQKVMAYSQNKVAPVGRLLFDPDFTRVARALKGLEIPLILKMDLTQGETPEEKTTLARGKSGISWVMAESQEMTAPQLWVEKDVFTPQRLIFKNGSNVRRVDFDSVRYFREFPILRNIQVKDAEEKLILKEEVIEVQFSDSGFGRVSTSGTLDSIPGKVETALREYDELLR